MRQIPNTHFIAYGAQADATRLFDMLVDTDGDLLDEAAQQVGSAASDFSLASNAYFASVISDAAGNIIGRGVAGDGQANWGGFQLLRAEASPVSVPSSALLVILGLLGLSRAARKRVSHLR